MKQTTKKLLALLTALVMLLPTVALAEASGEGSTSGIPQVLVAPDKLMVNSTNTGIIGLPEEASYVTTAKKSPDAGNMRAYKLTDSFGLTGGKSVIEMVAREQRANDPQLLLEYLDFNTESDFYLTTNVYLGDARDIDVLQLGGRYRYTADNGSTANSSPLLFFTGDGRIIKTYAKNYSEAQTGGRYEKNNWYRLTMAVIDKDVKIYFDDILVNGKHANVSVAEDLPDMGSDVFIEFFGARIRNFSDTTEWGGLPQWFAMREMKLVEGTYDPAATSTAVSSDVYAVTAKSAVIPANSETESSITGVEDNTSAADFIANLTLPEGASASVVKINDDDKKTTLIADDETVTSKMKLLVTSKDNSLKLYDIDVELDSSKYPVITSSSTAYVVDATAKTVTVPDTTVAKLTEKLTGADGTTVLVKDANGNTVDGTASVNETMTLVASNAYAEDEYEIALTGNYGVIAMNQNGTITNTAADTVLYSKTYTVPEGSTTGAWSSATGLTSKGKIPGWGNSDGSITILGFGPSGENSSATVTPANGETVLVTLGTMPTSGVKAVKIHGTHPALVNYQSNKNLQPAGAVLEKTVMEFKIYLEEGATAGFEPIYNVGGSATQCGDMIRFQGGNIYLGRRIGSSDYASAGGTNLKIGTYNCKQEYNVTIVKSTPYIGGTASNLTIEGIYIDGTKIFPASDGGYTLTEDGYYQTNATAAGLNYIRMLAGGGKPVYIGDVKLYMTDDYNPVKETTVGEADLSIESEALSIDAENMLIKGWEGLTAAQLKAAIDSDINTELSVLDVTGSGIVSASAEVSVNMIVCVADKNYPENAAYYLLTKDNYDSGTSFEITAGEEKTAIKAQREIRIYNAEEASKSMTLVIAAYASDGSIALVKTATKAVYAPNTYSFEAELNYNEAYTYKAFMWDMNTLIPYENAVPYVAE